ncbi:DUF1127 domain-containing protein [Tropicimonas sp.]|uniref:DUF1127 domain-containing protein n=1 Tax=Tropicimonas sp. TaxID=2067044 RepID=UPI003A86415F
MAFYDTPQTTGHGPIRRFISGVAQEIVAWRERNETRKALSKLSDGELSDIGFLRADLDMTHDDTLHNG